jgi:hypothetical protein
VLCLVHGRTQEQAAAELGGSVRTLRRRLDRAKALLRVRLERRGVVPAVAAGLVAGVGEPAAAVPADLARAAVCGAVEFLTGGRASTPAAVVAKGVVMGTAKLKAAAVVAVSVMALGLGVGWASGDPPAAIPPANVPLAAPQAPAAKPQPPSLVTFLDHGTVEQQPVTGTYPGATHRSANFVVHAPTPVLARAVAAEAEYQRKELAVKWLGKELPPAAEPCVIRYAYAENALVGSSTFTYGPDGKHELRTAATELQGQLVLMLQLELPRQVTHLVFATHFGRQLPRWAEQGVALLTETASGQVALDRQVREFLNAGRGYRLRTLLSIAEFPQDLSVLYAQSHSLVRFLLARTPTSAPFSSGMWVFGPDGDEDSARQIEEAIRKNARQGVIRFLTTGMAGGWDKAVKEVYRFESVDALEQAWLEWLKTPESRPPAGPTPTPRPAPRPPLAPDLIPPANLPADQPVPRLLGAGAMPVNSREFPIRIDPRPEEKGRIKEFRMFVSQDEGKSWALVAAAPPDRAELKYTAPADGVYWFHLVKVFSDGMPVPSAAAFPPAPRDAHIKLLVDTTPPLVRVTGARRETVRAGEPLAGKKLVRVDWEVYDENLDDRKTVVEHRPAGSGAKWKRVEVAEGFTHVLFDDPGGPLEVRVTAADRAGNVGTSAVKRVN